MGSGVAASMHAADIATRAVVCALNRDNATHKGLWEYNYKYQTKRGAILASYDLIRRFLQSLTTKQINDVFKSGFLRDRNFMSTFSSNEIHYNINMILENLISLFGNLKLLSLGVRFGQMARDSQKLLKLYKEFPGEWDRKAFLDWQEKTEKLIAPYSSLRTRKK
jgi:flavin-dependent dehydrogenase